VRAGLFITLEGIDGTGKGTQARLLRDHLVKMGLEVEYTREPGGPPIAEAIRGILLSTDNSSMHAWTEAFLYLASRSQNTRQVIIPALEAGKLVLCERYADSTIAYQGAGRGLPIKTLDDLNKIATAGIKPDVTIIFDLNPDEAHKRAKVEKTPDRLESEKSDFHKRIREGYLSIARAHSERVIIIPVTGTAQQVFDQLWNKLEPFIAKYLEKSNQSGSQ